MGGGGGVRIAGISTALTVVRPLFLMIREDPRRSLKSSTEKGDREGKDRLAGAKLSRKR